MNVAYDEIRAPLRRRSQNRERDGIDRRNKERAGGARRFRNLPHAVETTEKIRIGRDDGGSSSSVER